MARHKEDCVWNMVGSGGADCDCIELYEADLERVQGELKKMTGSRNWNRVANEANRMGRCEAEAYLIEAEATNKRLTEALEKVVVEMNKRLDEAARLGINTLCLSEVKHIAVDALTTTSTELSTLNETDSKLTKDCPGCTTFGPSSRPGLIPHNGHSWGDGSRLCKLCNGTGKKPTAQGQGEG